jgi:hypothetical protein
MATEMTGVWNMAGLLSREKKRRLGPQAPRVIHQGGYALQAKFGRGALVRHRAYLPGGGGCADFDASDFSSQQEKVSCNNVVSLSRH